MATEPERDIEKTLKAYARTRREEAGAPLELHPATRGQLQREAARLADRTGERPSLWREFFALSWPKYAFLVLVFLLPAICARFVLPARAPKPMSLAQNTLPQTALEKDKAASSRDLADRPAPAAPPAAVMPPPQRLLKQNAAEGAAPTAITRDDRLPAPVTDESAKELALGKAPARLDGPVPNVSSSALATPLNPPALSPAPAGAPAPMVAVASDTADAGAAGGAPALAGRGGRGGRGGARGGRAGRGPQGAAGPALAAQPAAAYAVENGTGALPSNAPIELASRAVSSPVAPVQTLGNRALTASDLTPVSGSLTQRFVRVQNTVETPPGAGRVVNVNDVLYSFRVEQDDGQLRIIDADGSTYSGYVGLTNAVANQPVVVSGAVPADSLRRTTGTGENLFFRVSGTNLSLHQQVLFTGNLLRQQTTPPQSPQTVAGGGGGFGGGFGGAGGGGGRAGAAQTTRMPPAPAYKFQIHGQVLIGATNTMDVNATPTGQ